MYPKIKLFLKNRIYQRSPWTLGVIRRYKREIKYAISGGTAAAAALITVYISTDIFKVWYLFSVVFGQVAGFFVNFYLQKFWTFRDPSKERMERQFKFFMVLVVLNIILNAIFVSALVEVFHLWYMLAQAIVLTTLVMVNYLFNRFITFRQVNTVYESLNDKY
ncbi:MAG: hypothetical protein CO042_00980 [Parcubacteria group bacterium CG_4_9_14_0_2_um_filter_41_8]|nr:MAG: hypothetical protein AUJ34_00550 [Parcubacteria group bacterium CG1_02_41_12]PIP66829.1 MAG: hypothetical protein COW93_03510 [Parcubacteria group bacterium CG22_combo_CG10-13_8_21_14_all_41_9]PIZ81483.1 MAG: hypothetical protein COY02_01770 [Parcubacteria group bacterium CG_4_10_14_0_2_um_filter_41_6]PJC40953.1 MAG: hypothetical protein CO042_00980 [Parcubacteria group bacterium CG_4_9_14_0_2_um_filter_41_8]